MKKEKIFVINTKYLSKYNRRKNNYVGLTHLFASILEQNSDKSIIEVYYLDKYYLFHKINYIGRDIVNTKSLEEYDENKSYKNISPNSLVYKIENLGNNNFSINKSSLNKIPK